MLTTEQRLKIKQLARRQANKLFQHVPYGHWYDVTVEEGVEAGWLKIPSAITPRVLSRVLKQKRPESIGLRVLGHWLHHFEDCQVGQYTWAPHFHHDVVKCAVLPRISLAAMGQYQNPTSCGIKERIFQRRKCAQLLEPMDLTTGPGYLGQRPRVYTLNIYQRTS